MISLQHLLSFALFFLSLLPRIATSSENCPVSYCGTVEIKFPFQLLNGRPSTPRCFYPGFNLFCNYNNQPILLLPHSKPYVVQDIDYGIQSLWINDPHNCLPKRFLEGFNLTDSPFVPYSYSNFTFYNCSPNTTVAYPYRPINCLSHDNHTAIALPSMFYDESTFPSSCEKISTVPIPDGRFWSELEGKVRLMWSKPFCAYCEQRGQACGYNSDGSDVGCSDRSSSGTSRGTKYGIIIGLGLPGALCIFVLGCCLCYRARTDGQRRHPNTELSSSIAPPQSAAIVTGLDGPTIDSYPKTLVGESGRLPKPNDNTCPICLCEYQPKDILRTIPECNHYFHSNCIDEWLRRNASCPLCRNLPDASAAATLSSASVSSRSSSVLSP